MKPLVLFPTFCYWGRMIARLLTVSPVFLDGFLWALVALFMFQQAFLSTEEAYKYCNPTLLFWIKFTVGSLGAMVGSLKAFRSTSFAHHLAEKAAETGAPDPPATLVNSPPVPVPLAPKPLAP